jgi:hypothetical protein
LDGQKQALRRRLQRARAAIGDAAARDAAERAALHFSERRANSTALSTLMLRSVIRTIHLR